MLPRWFMAVIAGMLLALPDDPKEAAPKETLVRLRLHASLKGKEELYPSSLVFSPDGKLLASLEGEKLLADMPEEIGITSLVFSPDGRLLATEFRTGIELWTIPTGEKKPVNFAVAARPGKPTRHLKPRWTTKLWSNLNLGVLMRLVLLETTGKPGEIHSLA